MRRDSCSNLCSMLATGLVMAGIVSPCLSQAATFQTIYSLSPHTQYSILGAPLVADREGNLYGTDYDGGPGTNGFVFRLAPPAAGSMVWTATAYAFGTSSVTKPNGPQGVAITGQKLVGATFGGGLYNEGAVYELKSDKALTVLHDFSGGTAGSSDGANPSNDMIRGLFGMYYGATSAAGALGTVYGIDPSATAPQYVVAHRFGGPGDGVYPTAGTLAVDAQNRLFGITQGGGGAGLGTLYMVSYVDGAWTEQVIYSFDSSGSQNVNSNVVVDRAGNLYVVGGSGLNGAGAVLKFSPPAQAGGAWAETVLYNFTNDAGHGDANCGSSDACGLAIDPVSGKLYGTSESGGKSLVGTIFEVDPPASGQTVWTETVLHSFGGTVADPAYSFAAPLLINNTLYGTTAYFSVWSLSL